MARLESQRLLKLARLVHLHHDVAAADQLAIDEQLRDGGPVRQGRELLPDAGIGQDVDGRERASERLEDGDGAGGEPTRGLLGSPLHEQQHRVIGDGLADLLAERVVPGIGGGVDGFVHTTYSGLVWIDRAWMRSPTSAPNTS